MPATRDSVEVGAVADVEDGEVASAAREGPPLSADVLSAAQEQVFLTMHLRKMQRDLNGPQREQSKYHYAALACLLVLVYGLSAYQREVNPLPQQNGQVGVDDVEDSSNNRIAIVLTVPQIALIGVWIFVSIVITGIFAGSRLIHILYWMFVYFPLLAMLASVLFYDETAIFGGSGDVTLTWIAVALIVLEVVTLLAYVLIYYAYPKLVASTWFRTSYGARRYFRLALLDDWTLEYDGRWGRCSRRYMCRYVGEVHGETGLPHGRGVWSDDSYNGEVLTGRWDNGKPVAPFDSRQYGGKGNTFAAVQLAFFMASDDTFEANKLKPTNDLPPRCGVVGVECSIAGDFYSHLPEASLLVGPQTDGEGLTIGQCCRMLEGPPGAGFSANEPTTALHISSDDPRGVQIAGHVYAPTGVPFTKRLKQIVINVTAAEEDGPEYHQVLGRSVDDEENPDAASAGTGNGTTSSPLLRLEAKNWAKITARDALIFLPGFNSWLKHSAETLGQMVAMTKLSRHVYPVLFSWPGGQVPTYRHASFASATEKNRRYFLQMLHGLKQEGIQNIHIVTHSLGVQTLMSAFQNKSDGSASDVSECFRPAPAFADAAASVSEVGKLVCRTITMLNPDFPVLAFREHGFASIRRVCRCITVVGDKNDQALWWSGAINGACNAMKYDPPSVLDSEARRHETGFTFQQPIGRDIESLCVVKERTGSEGVISFQHKQNQGGSFDAVSGAHDMSTHSTTSKKSDGNITWLDVDVIDTTGLDTNVNDLRHAAFSVNSILLRDIEELVVTGKRACDRTTLLHKAGNVYEYCHAPSFVKPE